MRCIVLAAMVVFYVGILGRVDWRWIEKFSLILYIPMLLYALGPNDKVLTNNCTKKLSKISFELYLSQMLGFRLLEKVGLIYKFGNGWCGFIVTFIVLVVILGISVSLYKILEKKVISIIQ